MLARAHQLDLARKRHTNALRSALREYYPAALEAFEDLALGDALGVLERAPGPEQGARLDLTAIRSALKRGGRKRNIAARPATSRPHYAPHSSRAHASHCGVRRHHPRRGGHHRRVEPPDRRARRRLAAHFETHPDADIYRSLPGLCVVLGARVFGEFGDDPNRYTSAKRRRNYAGTSPLTVASGKKRAVLARHVVTADTTTPSTNGPSARSSPAPAREVLRPAPRRRRHPPSALRALGNRLVGFCTLPTPPHALYNRHTAGPPHHPSRLTVANLGCLHPIRFSPPVTSRARAGLWFSDLSRSDANPICLTGRCISYDGPCSPLIGNEAR